MYHSVASHTFRVVQTPEYGNEDGHVPEQDACKDILFLDMA